MGGMSFSDETLRAEPNRKLVCGMRARHSHPFGSGGHAASLLSLPLTAQERQPAPRTHSHTLPWLGRCVCAGPARGGLPCGCAVSCHACHPLWTSDRVRSVSRVDLRVDWYSP